MSSGCTFAGEGGQLDLITACVLSEKYTEVRGEREPRVYAKE